MARRTVVPKITPARQERANRFAEVRGRSLEASPAECFMAASTVAGPLLMPDQAAAAITCDPSGYQDRGQPRTNQGA